MPEPKFAPPVSESAMKSPGQGVKENGFDQVDTYGGGTSTALGVAVVTRVDAEKLEITLRIETGEQFQHTPVPMTFPGGGARHFLGVIPMVGDACVVGWGMAESGRSRTPFVLAWLIPGVTAGHDWWVTQPFSRDEFALTATEKAKFEGIAHRTRHKLRHMRPGEVVASSGMGADLVLNEGVLLTNRRGDELRLRDQDSALVIRTSQQFHAGSGFRIYGGMVQRDGASLPTTMFSDGTEWAPAALLDEEGTPLIEGELEASDVGAGRLTPNPVFQTDADGARISGRRFGQGLDPYVFLQKGLLIDANGRATGNPTSSAVYGGKSVYRVSTTNDNAVLDPNAEAFSEYRIEVAHTSDGRLPVTEQTDGFDAERLPDSVPRTGSPLNSSAASPFVEFVLGSVVGNDPFSVPGKAVYGIPLRPQVFEGESRSPKLVSALGAPIPEHAASLFQVRPPLDPTAQPSWWSVTKDGRAMLSVAGPGTGFSAEAAFASGLRMGAGRTGAGDSVRVEADGRVLIRSSRGDNATNRGIEITSDQGAVRIYGGGQETVGGIAARGSSVGESGLPGVTVESATNLLLKASQGVVISAPKLDLKNIQTLSLQAQSGLSVQSGDGISMTSKVRDMTTMGKSTETYGGPKDALPTAGALRETQFVGTPLTGFLGGTADKYSMVFGNRSETILAGNHDTSIVVGNLSYRTAAGAWTAQAGVNTLAITPGGITGVASSPGSAVVFNATAGSASVSASMAVAIVSTGGPVLVSGKAVVLSATGGKTGGIVSSSDLDPTSGKPLITYLMGSPTHTLLGV